MRRILLLVCLFTSACGSGQQKGDTSELVLRGDGIAQQIQTSLAGATGEFHGDRIGADGKRLPGCFLQLGPGLGDRRFEFSLPDRVLDLGYAGEIVYKVHNVRLQGVQVKSGNGEFVITASFVSKDVALKGSHSWLGDAAVPDIELENMRLVVYLKPTVTRDNEITYDQPRVEFTANVDNTFMPRFAVLGQTIDVMDTLTNYRRELCKSIQKQMQKALDDPARKALLAKKISEGINGQIVGPSGAIVGLRFQGTDLVVQLRK